MVPTSRHAARSREARPLPAGAAPGLSSGAGRLISVVSRPGRTQVLMVLGELRVMTGNLP